MSGSAFIAPLGNIPNTDDVIRYIAQQVKLIAAVQTGGGSGGGGVPAGKQRVLTTTTPTGNGSVAVGAIGVQFILSSDFAGTIDGATFSGTTSAFWSPPPLLNPNDTYPAIPYTISAGSAVINVLT